MWAPTTVVLEASKRRSSGDVRGECHMMEASGPFFFLAVEEANDVWGRLNREKWTIEGVDLFLPLCG